MVTSVYTEIKEKINELHDFVANHPSASNIALQIALVYIEENSDKIDASRIQLLKCDHPQETQFLAKSAEQPAIMAQKMIQVIVNRSGEC